MKCRAKPYLGQEPFAFFSYCHKDSARVYPLIEGLTELGYRIWFDEGIGIGDEWPEVIARKLEECTLFLVAMTPDYCHSHNCKNEMTYQVEDRKPMLPLMLENFPLSGGIKLQLATSQYLRLFEQPEKSWAAVVAGSGLLAQCKGAPVTLPPREDEKKAEAKRNTPLITENHAVKRKAAAEQEKESETLGAEALKPEPEIQSERQQSCQVSDEFCAVLVENGKVLFGREGQVILTPGQQQPGPVLSARTDGVTLEEPGQAARLIAPGTLLHTDAGTFLPISRTELDKMKQLGALRFLQAERTGEIRHIGRNPICLGRSFPWSQGVFSDHEISRHHADVMPDEGTGKVRLVDRSQNGTFVNDERMYEARVLEDGDKIGIGPDLFRYHSVTLDFSDEERERSYDNACALLNSDGVPENITQAERIFGQLGDFRDCGALQLRCKQKLEVIRQEGLRQKEALYQQAIQEMECGDYDSAGQKLAQLWDYKDAEVLLKRCAELAATDDRTIIDAGEEPDDGDETVYRKSVLSPQKLLLIVELTTGEVFRGKYQSTVIGRKANQCDLPFPNNGCMSRRHAELFTSNGVHYVRDCDSSNGTWLNGQPLERKQTEKIGDTAVLDLAGTRLLVAFDEGAARLQRQKVQTYLENMETGALLLGSRERQQFQAEDPEATVGEGHSAMSCCAYFWQDGNTAWLESEMEGSVLWNGTVQPKEKTIELRDGDTLRIGDADYRFRSLRLVFL